LIFDSIFDKYNFVVIIKIIKFKNLLYQNQIMINKITKKEKINTKKANLKKTIITLSTLVCGLIWFWQEKQFWTDISKYNSFNYEKFVKRNRQKRDDKENNPEKDVRWVNFVYIRSSTQNKIDKKAISHFENIKKYNQDPRVKENEKIAVGCYHYFWHTSTNVNTQIDVFIRQYNQINKENDWIVDLIPMLDIESLVWANKEHVRKRSLQRINWVEEKTWVTPWIYISATNYYNFIHGDKRFDKYKIRIAAYSTDRINQDKWSVKVWPRSNMEEIKPDIYQFGEGGVIWWIWARWNRADMNNTNNIEDLIIKNSDYEWENYIKDFKYHRISVKNDTAYKVYSYTIKNHWNRRQILNVFAKNGWDKEDALVTDAKGIEYDENIDHQKWTKVYIKEKIKHKEYWEDFEYEWLEEINDKYFHKYSYTIKEWWNYGWVLKQFETNWGKLDWTKVYMLDNYDNLVELDRKSRYMKWIKVFVLEEI